MPPSRLQPSYAYCERVARREAGNFYHAFSSPPVPTAGQCAPLYAFLRFTDDLSDGPGSTGDKRAALKQWRTDLHVALAGDDRHPCHPALRHTLTRFGVPVRYLDEVIDGCESDLEPVRMPDFDTLYRYCYRVASAVGLACIHVWGFRDAAARTHAEHAGVALQLTNILPRPCPRTWTAAAFTIPAEDLERFGLRPASLGDPADPAFRRPDAVRGRASAGLLLLRGAAHPIPRRAGSSCFPGSVAHVSRAARRDRAPRLRRLPRTRPPQPVEKGGNADPGAAGPLGVGRMRPTALVIGGGLAGLAAASALAPRGYRVTPGWTPATDSAAGPGRLPTPKPARRSMRAST